MNRERELLDLVDKVYDAATDSSLWPLFLVALQDYFKAEHIVMGLTDLSCKNNSISMDFAVDFDPEFQESYNSYYCRKNVMVRRASQRGAIQKGRILDFERVISIEELKKTEFYNDWGRPQNLFLGYAPVLSMDEDTFGLLSIARGHQTGALTTEERLALEMLTSHLTRAVELHLRLGFLESVRSLLLEQSNRFPGAIVFLNADGTLITQNDAAKRILDRNDGLSVDKKGKLYAARREDTKRMNNGIAAALKRPALAGSDHGPLSLPRPSGKRSYSVLCFSVRMEPLYSHQDHAHVLVFIDDPDTVASPSTVLLRRFYGLTRAEAEVAVALCRGKSINKIAIELNRSKNTIRTLVQRIFHKTDTTRQAELVTLLLSNRSLTLLQ
jgi:DNA-binding CsgD family transcriptional regulator